MSATDGRLPIQILNLRPPDEDTRFLISENMFHLNLKVKVCSGHNQHRNNNSKSKIILQTCLIL